MQSSHSRYKLYESCNFLFIRDVLPLIIVVIAAVAVLYITRNLEGDIWVIWLGVGIVCGIPTLSLLFSAFKKKFRKDRIIREGKHAVFKVTSSVIGVIESERLDRTAHLSKELSGKLVFDTGEVKQATVTGLEYLFQFKDEELDCYVNEVAITFVKAAYLK